MPCGWGGNRRSSVAPAIHQTSVLRAQGLEVGDEHPPPPMLSCGARLTLHFSRVVATGAAAPVEARGSFPNEQRSGSDEQHCYGDE